MQLLLKKDRLGEVIEGSDQELIARATQGDDIVLYEESSAFSCYIVFGNYAISADRISGLSLPHMAHAQFANPDALAQSGLTTIQYIYDSQNKNLLCKEILDEQCTITSIWANNPHYSSLTWYATREYVPRPLRDSRSLKTWADQFKIRLEFCDTFKVIFKPVNIRFGNGGTDFQVKSSVMILPTEFASKPKEYLAAGDKPLIANRTFSLAYLNINSNRTLTIVHKQCYSALEDIDKAIERSIWASVPTAQFEGWQVNSSTPTTGVTRLECDYTILMPDKTVS